MPKSMEGIYKNLIKEKKELFPDWFHKMNFESKLELLDAHFIITDECFGHQHYYIYQTLLYKLSYFKGQKDILYADQVQVIKRNVPPGKPRSQTKLFSLFEPADMFIKQCEIIKKKREDFLANKDNKYSRLVKELETNDLF